MHNFKELRIWQDSRSFCTVIYKILKNFPEYEKFGLTNQIRRAAISIPSNITEGAGRVSDKDFAKFISYSLGSSYELETQLLIAFDLKYISEEDLNVLVEELNLLQKMINKFYNYLNQKE